VDLLIGFSSGGGRPEACKTGRMTNENCGINWLYGKIKGKPSKFDIMVYGFLSLNAFFYSWHPIFWHKALFAHPNVVLIVGVE
jgi:hypothetical protein